MSMSEISSKSESQGAHIKAQVRLMLGEEIAFGPGKADLLEAIAETGSISAAGRKLGMSYRRAWLLIDTMNRCFKGPLVASSVGGSGGGGAHLTELGEDVLKRYRTLQEEVQAVIGPHFRELKKHLKPE